MKKQTVLNDKRIIELHLVITKYCVLSAVSHRSIISLSLSASENNWSSPHSHITIFSSTLCNCCFNNNCINHQNGKSNFISSCNQAQFCALEWVLCNLYSTTSYKNTQLFPDTLMGISKIKRFQAKIIWIFVLGKILQGLIWFRR